MNHEVLMSFLLMQSLGPAGTKIPPEAVLTASDDIPAWARFTFQVKALQDLQAETDRLRHHHNETHEKLTAMTADRDAVSAELRALATELKANPNLLNRLRESGKYPTLARFHDDVSAVPPLPPIGEGTHNHG